MTDAALELAAQCWCDPETSSKEMDVELAKAFARRLDPLLQQLAECQAREKMLRDFVDVCIECDDYLTTTVLSSLDEVRDFPSDSEVLDAMKKQWQREALIEAATVVANMNGYNVEDISSDIRYMAEELK